MAEQLRQLGIEQATIILEPEGKNTAPAIALAAHAASASDPESLLLVLPADHYIGRPEDLRNAVTAAIDVASDQKLVTFGLIPSRPETGYGYIKRGADITEHAAVLETFVEKPDVETAEAYLASGEYVWNSGMFMFSAQAYLSALESSQTDMATACRESMNAAERDLDFIRPDADIFATSPADSIDYAVMEHTADGAVVSLDCDWSDIGAWSALWEAGTKDESGNVTEGDVVLDNTSNSYIRSQSRLVTTTGVKDLVVVETADAVMVADRYSVQDVKNIVSALKSASRARLIAIDASFGLGAPMNCWWGARVFK